jgi:DNA-binding CsgD family transcriptional regulator
MHTVAEYDQRSVEAFAPLNLTPREAEVLLWISRGKSNHEIGVIVGAKTGTVCKHVEHIFSKLNVENRTSAALVALEASRWTEPASESDASRRPWAAISGVIVMLFQQFSGGGLEICDAVSSFVG